MDKRDKTHPPVLEEQKGDHGPCSLSVGAELVQPKINNGL